MNRAILASRAAEVDLARVIDRVILDADERYRRRIVLTGERGTTFLLDLPQAVALREGDGLVLENGSIVQVCGKPEPVLDIAATSAPELARFAWHLGNRHTEVQIIGDRLRIRRDHVLEQMLKHLGARVTSLDAPFDPESGAYGRAIGHLAAHGLGRTDMHDHEHHHAHDDGRNHARHREHRHDGEKP